MTFMEGLYLVVGVFVGLAGIAIVRWLVLRRAQRALASSLIEELNTFNGQIRRLNDRLGELNASIETRSRAGHPPQQNELGEALSEMNRLLREINEFFSQEPQGGPGASDFTNADEATKFLKMNEISEDEIRRTNWDEVIDKLREEGKK